MKIKLHQKSNQKLYWSRRNGVSWVLLSSNDVTFSLAIICASPSLCFHDVSSSAFRPHLTRLKGELQEQVSWYLKLQTSDKWTSQKTCVYLNRGVGFEGGGANCRLSVTVITILLTINLYNHTLIWNCVHGTLVNWKFYFFNLSSTVSPYTPVEGVCFSYMGI